MKDERCTDTYVTEEICFELRVIVEDVVETFKQNILLKYAGETVMDNSLLNVRVNNNKYIMHNGKDIQNR